MAMPLDLNPPDPSAETGPNVYGKGVAEDLRELIQAVGPERISAFIMEPVGGAGAPGTRPRPDTSRASVGSAMSTTSS